MYIEPRQNELNVQKYSVLSNDAVSYYDYIVSLIDE
jgi:hypothetical protein